MDDFSSFNKISLSNTLSESKSSLDRLKKEKREKRDGQRKGRKRREKQADEYNYPHSIHYSRTSLRSQSNSSTFSGTSSENSSSSQEVHYVYKYCSRCKTLHRKKKFIKKRSKEEFIMKNQLSPKSSPKPSAKPSAKHSRKSLSGERIPPTQPELPRKKEISHLPKLFEILEAMATYSVEI